MYMSLNYDWRSVFLFFGTGSLVKGWGHGLGYGSVYVPATAGGGSLGMIGCRQAKEDVLFISTFLRIYLYIQLQ